MKVKVFQSNHNGKIEFTRAELEKLLNEVYTDGYNEGKSSHWTWTSPYLNSCDGITLTNAIDTKIATDKTTSNYNTDKIPTLNATLNSTHAVDNEIKNNPSYTVKVNGTDISKLVNDIFGARASNSVPENVVDAFDKLAKELNF
jgi:hypothetical protein